MRTLIGFGASTMQGAGDPEGGFLKRMAPHLPDWRVLNHGIGGDTTRDMLLRAPAVHAIGADATVVLLGCNDLPRARDGSPDRRTTLADYRGNLEQILAIVKAKRSLFVTSFRVSEEKTGVSSDLLRPYMQTAMEVARAHGYDAWDLFSDTFNDGPRFWAADGMHYNAAGHQHLADRVLQWLGAK